MKYQASSKTLAIGIAYLMAYVALDYISFLKPYHGLGITPWNPPPGLSLALVFFGGPLYAPYVIAAPGVAEFVVRGSNLGLGVAFAASATSGVTYLVAGLVLRRVVPFDPRLESLRDVLFLIAVALGAALIAAVSYALILPLLGVITWNESQDVIWRCFVGNVIGALVMTPIVLLVVTKRDFPSLRWLHLLQLLAITAALFIVFGYREATAFQLFYLLFLPLLWIALSDGTAGSVVALVLIQIGLILGAEIRFGADPGLTALQVLLIALAITGLIVGAIVSERGIAALRLREQQDALNRAFRLRSAGEIAATIAHEINQPLTALTTYSGIAAQAMSDGKLDLAATTVAKIKIESSRANAVLRSIRELLRQGGLTKTTVNLHATLTDLSNVVTDDLSAKGLSLTVYVPGSFPSISADKTQIQQAVHNLIINSAEAMFQSGIGHRIDLKVRPIDAHSFVISVIDDGPGFPAGVDKRDPTPFVTTKPEGSGLGLIVARSIAESHGGSLAVASTMHGAQVDLRLPLIGAQS